MADDFAIGRFVAGRLRQVAGERLVVQILVRSLCVVMIHPLGNEIVNLATASKTKKFKRLLE
jgi:hypothetical protein